MPTADQKSGACKATFLLLVLTAERKNMNSFMSWVGGKKNLRDEVLARFPPYYERYIEVFGGAGWVLFHKPPGMDFEVYNDFNGNLSNLYRCVRDKPNKLKYKLRYVLNSREDFDRIALLHKRGIFEKLCDADRASKFYQLIRYSYASGLDSFGSQPHSMWSDFPMIDLAARRLQKVVVENKDFEKYKYLAEYALAGSAFFMPKSERINSECKAFERLQSKLKGSYKPYTDKGKKAQKQRALQDCVQEVLRDLKRTARTREQSVNTAKLLYQLADRAVRLSVEEALSVPIQEQCEDIDIISEPEPCMEFG